MATLENKLAKNTYKDLLKINSVSDNSGIDSTLRTVEDGDATASALQISSAGIKSTGTLAVDGVSTLTGAVTSGLINSQTISSAANFTGTLGVTGATTIQGLTVGKGGNAGNYNSAMGVQALYSNTTGNYNSAMGLDALRSNTTGNYNSAMGLQALYSNTIGNSNSAMGVQALYTNTGNYNSAIGVEALYSNTIGNKNTAVGYNTGLGITTGNSNTIIGANVTGLSTTLSNNIIIADGDGVQRIMVNSSGSIYQSNNSSTWAVTSDERTKENIEIANLKTCFENIKNLKLKRFNYKNEVFPIDKIKDRGQLGFIAQEVEEYFPKSISKNDLIFNQKFEDVIIPAVIDADGKTIQPERTEKKLISEEKIENCYSLDSTQIIWALYGAVQLLIQKVETLEAK